MKRTVVLGIGLSFGFVSLACQEAPSPLGTSESTDAELARKGGTKSGVWKVPGDFSTIQEAIDDPDVMPGHRIQVGPGAHPGAVVTKAVRIEGTGKAVINDGPVLFASHPLGGDLNAGFFFPPDHSGDGASITNLGFEGLEFPVFSRGADGVTVEHNEMASPVQGVTNWRGSNWVIRQNVIEGLRSICGGGIGILAGDFSALADGVKGNLISHNTILGTLAVHPGDCGGYDGTGVVLFADFRFGRAGAVEISGNRIVKNTISMGSDTPGSVGFNAIELTDTRDDANLDPVIFDNAVGFNDWRGSDNGLVLTPANLSDANDISRNLGSNRGHGLPPSAFGPGGN